MYTVDYIECLNDSCWKLFYFYNDEVIEHEMQLKVIIVAVSTLLLTITCQKLFPRFSHNACMNTAIK